MTDLKSIKGDAIEFWEAMLNLEQGKKVRCIAWAPGHFMCKNHDNTSANDRRDFWFTIHEKWELYQEPEKQMTFQEAIVALKCGKKVKRSCWKNPDATILLKKVASGNWCFLFIDEHGKVNHLDLDDFEANDWMECT